MSKYTRVCKWDIVFAYNIQLLLILDVYSIYKILRSGVQQQNNLYFCSILEDYSGNAICVKCQLAFFNYSKYCSSHARFNITHTHTGHFKASEIPCSIHLSSLEHLLIFSRLRNQTSLRSKYKTEQRMVNFISLRFNLYIYNLSFFSLLKFKAIGFSFLFPLKQDQIISSSKLNFQKIMKKNYFCFGFWKYIKEIVNKWK